MASRTHTISELAAEFDVTARTIRHYEEVGLIRPRRNGQTRIYGSRDRGRLILILRGRRVGFRLSEIKEMLDLYDVGDGQVTQLNTVLAKARLRIAALEQQKRDIEDVIGELATECAKIEKTLGRAAAAPAARAAVEG